MRNEIFYISATRDLTIQPMFRMLLNEFSNMKYNQLKRFVQKNTEFIKLDLVLSAKHQSFRRFYNELGKYDEFVIWLKRFYTNSKGINTHEYYIKLRKLIRDEMISIVDVDLK